MFYQSVPKYMTLSELLGFIFVQKILGFNRHVPIPVDPSCRIAPWENIEMGEKVYLNVGNYLQAPNGIRLGANIWIGPHVCIISANHDPNDFKKYVKAPPIEIGNNVWIGANAVILPGVKIGSNVVIGAGSIVTEDIPDNSIAIGNPCRVINEKQPYVGS